jgi:YD repeat-containing protein
VFPARPPQVLSSDPADRAGVPTGVSQASITFDASMFRGTLSDSRSVTRPENYRVVDMVTGLEVRIGAALYDPEARRVTLVFDALAASTYELRVANSIQDDLGNPLAATYTAEFSVAEDRTVALSPGLEFANTRLDRLAGTVSFDVRLRNTTGTPLTGPLRVAFDGLRTQGLSVLVTSPKVRVDATGLAYAELLVEAASLAPNAVTEWVTLTVQNPDAIAVNTTTRVQVGTPQNARPVFLSTPSTAAQASSPYSYRATASDPAGQGLSFVLVTAPTGATLEPTSGLLNWNVPVGGTSTATFEVRVIDSKGAYARQTWSVGINGLDLPPVLAPILDARTTAGEAFSMTFAAVDPEGRPLVFWMDQLPAGATFDATSRTLRWTPAGNQAGVYPSLRITASDGVNDTSRSFTLVVLPGNLPPVFQTAIDRTVSEGTTLTFTLRASDPEGAPVRFSSPNLPPGAVLVPDTGQFLWTPSYSQNGEYNLIFEAGDGATQSRQEVLVTILNVNGPVRFVPLDTLVIPEGQPLSVRVLAIDPNVPGGANTSAIAGQDPTAEQQRTLTYLVANLPAGASYDPVTHLLTWRPSFAQSGTYSLQFSVINDGDGTATPSRAELALNIQVVDTNGTPEVDPIANQFVDVGNSLTIPIRAVDPDAGPLRITAEGLPSFASLADNGNGTASIRVQPVPGQRGNYTITLQATDNGNGVPAAALTGTTSFILAVRAPNEPPVLEPVGDKVAIIGQPLVFTVRVSDPDQDPLTFAADNLPAGASFTGTSVYGTARFTWTPTTADAGTHALTLRVSDSGNQGATSPAADSETLSIVVRAANQAPVLSEIGARSANQSQPITFTLRGSDPDGDSLTFTVDQLPNGARLDALSGEFSWTPDFTQSGEFTVSFGATDGNRTDTESVVFTINRVNRAPFIATPAPTLGQEGLRFAFAIAGGDLDDDPLVYFAESLPTGATFDPESRLFSWTPGFQQSGVYEIVFTVQDSSGARGSASALVQILNVNRPPVFPAPAAHQLVAGQPFTLPVAASDPDGNTVAFNLENRPAGMTFNAATGVLNWTPVGAQAGRYDLPITVSDGLSSITQILTLVVSPTPVPPAVRVDLTPSFPVVPSATVTLQVSASSIAPIRSLSLTVNGQTRSLDGFGRFAFQPSTPGIYTVAATATDADGFTSTVLHEILVRDPADRTAPVTGIAGLATGSILSAPISISGSVQDTNLDRWTLELSNLDGSNPIELASSRTSIDGPLATLDPGRFENGAYRLRLIAKDIGGRTTTTERFVEINTTSKPGAYIRLETDFALSLGGISIPIARRYSSLAASQDSDFGFGWQFVLADPAISTNVIPTGREEDGFFQALTRGTRAYVTLPNGSRAGFTFEPVAIESGDRSYFRPAWVADAAVTFALASGSAVLRAEGNAFFQVGTGLPYNPDSGRFGGFDYSITSSDGTRYVYTRAEGLREIWGANGTRLAWTDSAITAPDGTRVSIERDIDGRITRLIAPDGSQAVYAYDSNGNLLQATLLEGNQRAWLGYRASSDHLLTEVIAPNPQSIRYDTNGLFLGADPVQRILGTSREFVSAPVQAALGVGTTARLAWILGSEELTTARSGRITVGVQIVTTGGWQPTLAVRGEPAGTLTQSANSAVALFTFDEPGPRLLEITSATPGVAGDFTVTFFLAGDANADGLVDGADEALFATAFGSSTGQAGFLPGADWNRDGRIDEGDRAYLDAGFGVVLNRAPTLQAPTVSVLAGSSITLDLNPFATDLDGNPLFFIVSQAIGGEVRLIDGGSKAVFTPNPGFSGNASFVLQADDGSLRSAESRFNVQVNAVAFTRFRIDGADAALQPGSTTRLKLIGDHAGGSLELSTEAYTVASSNQSVASVAPDGTVLARAAGTAIIEFRLVGGGSIATAVTVGAADARLLEFYPTSYALQPGETRQMIIRERLIQTVEDRSAAASGSRYFVSDPNIASVSADGLVTALKSGSVTVTLVNGGRSARSTLFIATPSADGAVLGASGGLVTNDGITVGLPAGALETDISIRVATLPQSGLPFALPQGVSFQGALKLDIGTRYLNEAVSLEMPAPAGSQPGDVYYLFQPGLIRPGNNAPDEQAWIVADTLVVGTDGKMRTTSPPNLGLFHRPGEGGQFFTPSNLGVAAVGSASLIGVLAAIDDYGTRLQSYQSVTGRGRVAPLVSAEIANGTSGPKYIAFPSLLGDLFLPLSSTLSYRVTTRYGEPSGLVTVATTEVRVNPGQTVSYGIPSPPRYIVKSLPLPLIQGITFDFGPDLTQPSPRMVLDGLDFLLTDNPYTTAPDFLGDEVKDLFITIEVGGRDTFDTDGNPLAIGGKDITIDGTLIIARNKDKLEVPIPIGAFVAGGYVTVSRKVLAPVDGEWEVQVVTGNPAQLIPSNRYSFAVNSGADSVSAIDHLHTNTLTFTAPGTGVITPIQKYDPREIARIVFNSDLPTTTLSPRNSTFSGDGSRLYVALNGGSGIGVIDTVALQEIDANPNVVGVQYIQLPLGSRPFDLAAETNGRYLYVSDESSNTVFIVDIDPFSATFHQHVRSIPLGPAPLGLRGIALNADESRVFVAAPGRTLFGAFGDQNGAILYIDTNLAIRGVPAIPKTGPSFNFVGPEPYDITATDDPAVMLFVDRLDDSRGVGILRRLTLPPTDPPIPEHERAQFWEPSYVSILQFGQIPRLIEGRPNHVFGVTNASSIAFLPADTLKDDIGSHPSYAFITGYNKFVQGDPRHDPNLPQLQTYNYEYKWTKDALLRAGFDIDEVRRLTGTPIGVNVLAGGNVGVIRNPLGSFASLETRPRLVAATSPIANSFPEGISIAPGSYALLAGFQSLNRVFAYDTRRMLALIESEAKGSPVAAFNQIAESVPIPDSLSRLLRGSLSSVPINVVDPLIGINADYRFYTNDQGQLVYGVPPTGPDGRSPNVTAPLLLGRLPRGLASPTIGFGQPVVLGITPYNQVPSLNQYPNDVLSVSSGIQSAADVHTGALQQSHNLVTYSSLGQTQGFSLHYDSLRAQPFHIYYFGVTGLPKDAAERTFITRLTIRDDAGNIATAAGISRSEAARLGLDGNELFFTLPNTIADGAMVGAGIPIDLKDLETGLYTAIFEYGMFKPDAAGRYTNGRFFNYTQPYAVVNTSKGIFGAGWSLSGVKELFLGDGGVLLVDGSGIEEIFLAPKKLGDSFSAISSADYSDLRQKPDGTFILRDKYGTEHEFNTDGKMSVVRDRNGNETLYTWSGENLLKITDPVGLETEFRYAGDRVVAILDPAKRTTTLTYDGNGNLDSITDPDSSRRRFDYGFEDFDHLLVSQTFKRGNDPSDPLGNPFQEIIRYNESGRVIGGTRVDGKKFILRPAQMLEVADLDLARDITKTSPTVELSRRTGKQTKYSASAEYTDFTERKIEFTMTGFGQYKSSKDTEDGAKSESDRRDETDGYITKMTDPVGNVVEYEYDVFGNLIKRTDYPDKTARKAVESYEYDLRWSLVRVHTDGSGRTFTNSFDGRGNVSSTVIQDPNAPAGSPSSITLQFTYTTRGQILTSTDGEGRVARYQYDSYGRTTRITYADGSVQSFDYNDLTGNPTSTTDEVGVVTTVVYDAMNRQTSKTVITTQGPVVWKKDYDAEGNLVREINSLGNVTTHAYDVLQRPIAMVIDPAGLAITYRYAYERGSLPTTYAVPGGKGSTYRYSQDPNGHTSVQVFDKNGRLTYEIDALGFRTQHTYNKASQLIQTQQPNGGIITFTPDGRGRVVVKTGPESERVEYQYDDANRLIRETSFNDDSQGGNQTTRNQYNLFDLVGVRTDALENITQLTFNRAGNVVERLEALGKPEQFRTTYAYDDRNREISRTMAGSATILTTYHLDGQIRSISDPRDASWLTVLEYDELKHPRVEVDAAGQRWHTTYDSEGNLIDRRDPRGDFTRWTFVYDKANRLREERDPVGKASFHVYDKAGNRIQTTDRRGAVTTMTYDARNDLLTQTQPVVGTSRFEYDSMAWLAASFDARGNTFSTRLAYDKSGRLIRLTDALGKVTTYDYDRIGNRIRETGPQGANYRTETTYDRLNRVVSTTQSPGTADAATVRQTYNGLGQVITSTDALGRITKLTYDALQHLSESVTAFGTSDAATWLFVNDKAGNVLSSTDPRGEYYTTTNTYDSLGRLVETVSPVGTAADPRTSTIRFTYDAAGNLVSKTDPRNAAWTITQVFDALNRLTRRIDQAGAITEFQYDPNGNLTTLVEADGRKTTYGFDALNRRQSIIEADSATTTFVYDAVGNLLSQIGPRTSPSGGLYAFTYTYDAIGRQLTSTDPEGNTTRYTYDDGGNIETSINPRGFVTRFSYDFRNRLIRKALQVGGGAQDIVETYSFDAAGNQTTHTDPRGFVTRYVYDDLNRLVRLEEPPTNSGGAPRVTRFQYDKVGNLIARTDPRGDYFTTRYAYDGQGRVIREERPQGTPAASLPAAVFLFEFDNAGNLVAATDPRGAAYVTRYTYDAQGRITRIEKPLVSPLGNPGVAVEVSTYDAAGKLLTQTDPRGEGFVRSYTYDARGRVATTTDPAGNVTTYTYDEAGNLLRRVDTDKASGTSRTYTYTYDGVGRRTSESVNGTFRSTFEFDRSGNLVSVTGPLTNGQGVLFVETHTYDGANRRTSTTDRAGFTTTFEYDPSGNVVSQTDGRGFTTTMAYTPSGQIALRSPTDRRTGRPW